MSSEAGGTCPGCGTFETVCLTPHGDGAVWLCWLCAHHVAHHDHPIDGSGVAECDCDPRVIYPPGTPEGDTFVLRRESARMLGAELHAARQERAAAQAKREADSRDEYLARLKRGARSDIVKRSRWRA